MLNGRLAPYLQDEQQAKDLSYALKIVINTVYGLTAAKFDNPFRDPRNKDNIVAKRGALFMIDLKHFVQERGFQVVHIKTDSIKIPNATPEIIEEVSRFGEKYGYTFEHEATYDKFCLVNDAVYIARYGWTPDGEKVGKWVAVGAQFQHPYVFKKLFSQEPVSWEDMCETKQVSKGSIYIDFDAVQKPMFQDKGLPGMHFVGRIGRFIPVTPESGGGILYRVYTNPADGETRKYAVAGTKGFFWLDANVAKEMETEVEIDESYYEDLLTQAYKAIEKYGDFQSFVE
jgi:hypothetical protein